MPTFNASLRIDISDPLPRHAQVRRILRDMVTDGRLKPGDKIPAELEIADALGVSKMTVNKALLSLTADGLFVREVGRGTFVTSKERFRNTHNLRKTGAAPPLAPRSRLRIALSFIHGAKNVLDNEYYGHLYRGIAASFERSPARGAELSLTPLDADDYVIEDARSSADGRLIIAPRAESVPSIEALWTRGKSLVVVGASWPTIGVPSVDSDNIGGAVAAVRHLADLGHKRIALLYAEPDTANTQDRIIGYRRALDAASLPHGAEDEICAAEAWRVGDDSHDKLIALTRKEPPVTAIFAAGYYLALEAMNAVRDVGLRVPEDVSVVGFDDPISASLSYPALTTIRQPLYDVGRRAVERLLRMLNGDEERITIRETIPTQIVVRSSTASARTSLLSRLTVAPAHSSTGAGK